MKALDSVWKQSASCCRQMDFLEQLLAEDEDNLCSYTMSDLENVVQLLMDEVRSQQEKIDETKADLQKMEAEVTESSVRRDYLMSLLAQTLPQREALEEEVRCQEKLLVATREMEKLREARGAASRGDLETRLVEAESLGAARSQQEKSQQEKVGTLRAALVKSEAKLGETTAELQMVESELLAVQDRLAAQPLARGEAAQRLARGEAAQRLARGEAAQRLARGEAAQRLARGEAAQRLARGEAAQRLARGEAAQRLARGEAARGEAAQLPARGEAARDEAARGDAAQVIRMCMEEMGLLQEKRLKK
ncbi:uncharacterized protein [Phyllobates terribilis]|uniref:uncharacterized protein isoform X2 n=1 Tax=Phyllobates terribilis TaxID=111132 RepID=UPI003CCB2452